ncbi:hypothetical protein M3223_18880 [Paenibacillus pasadenensis]|uniref:hypothetical protein n=1 Tax=Paenibacillus pasadenensis TaxID=217090 RepID=UPI00203EB595|nr:hypothetical protein [Paenibacillus pasadenensis]MCM3749420.1 hypothetical protein [Paenibacillus pasadenensis]
MTERVRFIGLLNLGWKCKKAAGNPAVRLNEVGAHDRRLPLAARTAKLLALLPAAPDGIWARRFGSEA